MAVNKEKSNILKLKLNSARVIFNGSTPKLLQALLYNTITYATWFRGEGL